MLTEIEFRPYLEKLMVEIAAEVQDERIIEAFRTVPRHSFLMQGFHFYNYETRAKGFYTLENTDVQTWLGMVYQNEALLTQQNNTGSPSSSSQPVLMAAMLEALDIRAGMHVLEIGTGTGYNAALVAELVGDSGRVDSIDNQAHLIEKARLVLQDFAMDRIYLHSGNGLLGVPEHAPYDRIIATASYARVPQPLIDQLAIGGKLLMNVGKSGGLLLLEKTTDAIHGHFIEQPGYFMALVDSSDEQKVEQVLKDIHLDDLKSRDFHFYRTMVFPEVTYISGEDSHHMSFRSTQGTDIVSLIQGDDVKARYSENDALAEPILDMIRQWYAAGKPKRSDYIFHLTDDGRQIIQIRNMPQIQIEL